MVERHRGHQYFVDRKKPDFSESADVTVADQTPIPLYFSSKYGLSPRSGCQFTCQTRGTIRIVSPGIETLPGTETLDAVTLEAVTLEAVI